MRYFLLLVIVGCVANGTKPVVNSPVKVKNDIVAVVKPKSKQEKKRIIPSKTHPVYLPNTDSFTFKSKINKIKYTLYISTPKDYNESDEDYPVIYLLDPHYSFAIANNLVEFLSDRKLLPKAIVVGIGYADNDVHKKYIGYESKDFSTYKMNRGRDYLPIPKSQTESDFVQSYDKFSGGGKKFQAVIEKNIFPYINKKYRTNGKNTLVGHSYGALFTTWVFLTSNHLFTNYIAVSPSLWYENNWIFPLIESAEIDNNSRIYLGVGLIENKTRMIDTLEDFAHKLEGRASIKHEVLSGENHSTAFPLGLLHGLQFVFNE